MKASKYINRNKQQTTRPKTKKNLTGAGGVATQKIETATAQDADDGR